MWTQLVRPLIIAIVFIAAVASVSFGQSSTPEPAQSAPVSDIDPGWLWDHMLSCSALDPSIASAHAGGPGSSGTYIFSGTGVTIYGVSSRTVEVSNVVHRTGKLRVTIDGAIKGDFPEFAAGDSHNTAVCIIRDLQYANHSLVIEPVDGWAGVSSLTIDTASQPVQASTNYSHETAFHGPHNIPGIVEAEDYDIGGSGVSFLQNFNGGQTIYRQDNNSAVQANSSDSNGYNLGWTGTGQWTKYTVIASKAGTYIVTFRVASPGGQTNAFHIQDEAGKMLTNEVSVPASGGNFNWVAVSYWILLAAGKQTLTLCQDNGSANWNIDSITFTKSAIQR